MQHESRRLKKIGWERTESDKVRGGGGTGNFLCSRLSYPLMVRVPLVETTATRSPQGAMLFFAVAMKRAITRSVGDERVGRGGANVGGH
jgi:hypothetical protein